MLQVGPIPSHKYTLYLYNIPNNTYTWLCEPLRSIRLVENCLIYRSRLKYLHFPVKLFSFSSHVVMHYDGDDDDDDDDYDDDDVYNILRPLTSSSVWDYTTYDI